LNFIKLGRIKPHPDIERFEDKTVYFVDGKKEEFDVIIYCTGYYQDIPLLNEYIEYKDGVPQLITGLFIPKLRNIYFLGIL
jgi:hypothetical protein